MSVGPVGALNPGPAPEHKPQFPNGPVQVADQSARTEQNAESSAKSVQFLPINANVPVQFLGFGKNGGETTQSNNSKAKSAAFNEAWTGQSLDQHQSVKVRDSWKQPEVPKGPHGPKDDGWKPDGAKDCPKGDGGWKPEGPKGHGPEGQPAFQGAKQEASTHQNAESKATSEQFLPINANVPVQFLSFGKNGGETTQSNNSKAKSAAFNEAWTGQSLDQHQSVKVRDSWKQPEVPKGPHGPKDDGRKPDGVNDCPKGDGGWKPEGPKGHGPEGQPAFQGAKQEASTDQNAESKAKSEQIAPINVNAPIQVLSFGKNGGETTQSNNSEAKSAAGNAAATEQSADQSQQAGSGPAFQGAKQEASTDQNAESKAKSEQIAPINVNAPIQIASIGHNGGDTRQSNNSEASSAAGNLAGTSQTVGQAQGVGVPGLSG